MTYARRPLGKQPYTSLNTNTNKSKINTRDSAMPIPPNITKRKNQFIAYIRKTYAHRMLCRWQHPSASNQTKRNSAIKTPCAMRCTRHLCLQFSAHIDNYVPFNLRIQKKIIVSYVEWLMYVVRPIWAYCLIVQRTLPCVGIIDARDIKCAT